MPAPVARGCVRRHLANRNEMLRFRVRQLRVVVLVLPEPEGIVITSLFVRHTRCDLSNSKSPIFMKFGTDAYQM